MLKSFYDKMGSYIHGKYAEYILAFCFYIEAIFFLPTDPMLILYCLERRDRALWYALIATLASVLGGITAYAIGNCLWLCSGHQIIYSSWMQRIMSPATFFRLSHWYMQQKTLAILLAGFTPIPYKAAAISAGFCSLPLFPFILCSVISRGARFFLFAVIIGRYGEHMKKRIEMYMTVALVLTVCIFSCIAYCS